MTIALIGSDGAGKTTIAKRLIDTFPQKMKYLYMGSDFGSSNIALPSSRFIQFLRQYTKKKSHVSSKIIGTFNHYLQKPEDRTVDDRGKLSAAIRLFNRLAEEWFRQFVAWYYQLRGFRVIYDRHFIFDYFVSSSNLDSGKKRLSDRIHDTILNVFFPKPDLVIFLDAPPEVLFQRKKETDLDYLKKCRETFYKQKTKTTGFIIVDSRRPVDDVFDKVYQQIINHSKFNKEKDRCYGY